MPYKIPRKRTTVKTIKMKNGTLTGEIDDKGNVYWFKDGKYITPYQMESYKYYDPSIKGYRKLGNIAKTAVSTGTIYYKDIHNPVYTPTLDNLKVVESRKGSIADSNDKSQSIPLEGQNWITLRTSGKMNLADVPMNLLDSIAVNAGRSNTDFYTDLALIGKENTFGGASHYLGRDYKGVEFFSPHELTNNHAYFVTPERDYLYASYKKFKYFNDIQKAEAEKDAKYAVEHGLLNDKTPHYSDYVLADAFKRYAKAPTKYNPGQPNYVPMLNGIRQELQGEKQLQNYWNTRGKQEYARGQKEGMALGGPLKDATPWNNLSVAEKAEMMRVAIHNGIFDLPTIKAKYNEFAEGGSKDKGMTGMMNLYSEGGYAPSKAIKSQIAKWEGSAMTGAIDPLSGKYSKNNSFEAEAKGFYNALPDNIRAQVLSNPELADHLYSYSYNVGAGNFKKRVVPALEKYYSGNGSIEDVVDSMWASGDSKLKGLQIRRAVEKTGVRQALLNDAINSTNASYIPVIPEVFNTSAETPTYQTPIYALEDLEIPAYQPTAEEVERQNRRDALDRFNTVMQLLGMDNPIQAAYPTTGNSFLDVLGALNDGKYSEGGGIHIKPENRGKFTALKERTGHSATWFKEHGTPAQKKMATFALNSRHWKHSEGGHIYSGEEEGTQKMQRGFDPSIPFWQQSTTPQWNYRTLEQIAADAQVAQQRRAQEAAAVRQKLKQNKKIEADIRKRQTDYLTTSNDNTWVESRDPDVRSSRPKNPHLKRRSIEGAKDHAAWEQDHPIMNAVGMTLGAAPFAVATAPAVTVAGDALAGSAVGQGITSLLTNPYFDAAMTSLGGAHAAQSISNGEADWMTALELTPLGRLAKPIWNASKKGLQYTAKVADNTVRYVSPSYDLYRTIGETPVSKGSLQKSLVEDFGVVKGPAVQDAAYKKAVESGNRPEALRLLEQAYLRSGVPKTDITVTPDGHAVGWYHGSEWGNHTVFDSSAMNATIGGASANGKIKGNFLTTDVPSAMRYAGSNKYSSANVPEYTSPQTFSEKIKNLFGMYKPRRLYPSERVGEYAPKPERLFDTKGRPPIEHLDKVDGVVYPLYVNPGENIMRLDFQGKPWSQAPVKFPNSYKLERKIHTPEKDWINNYGQPVLEYKTETVPYKTLEEAVQAFIKDPIAKIKPENPLISLKNQKFDSSDLTRTIEGFNSAPNYETVRLVETYTPSTTNGAVQTAAKEGKTSVLMRNVIDSNGGPEGTHYAIDDFVTLKPNQQKIADITYDNNGDLIPLSQRFNWLKMDNRFSWIPWVMGASTLGTTYGASQKAYGGNLYDEGGDLVSLLPTINIPEAIGNVYNAVKERAYKTITPQDYNIPRATKEFVRGKERNLKAVEPVRNEEWAMYLGVPYEGESNFEPSPYRPTKGKTYDKVLKFKDESKILSDAVLNQMLERQKKTGKTSYLVTGNGGGLGSYTLSLGEDENGKYISYYDDWDINPFKGISATTKIPIVSDIEDIIPGSNPFTVYGRRYYSKKTNKKKSLGGHI